MGVINHEVVIVTTWDDNIINNLKNWVNTLTKEEQSLFRFIPGIANGYETMVMAPDGSKKGWETSNRYRRLRDLLITELESFKEDDGSSAIDYIEVGYGEYGRKILRSNCKNRYNDKDYAE